MNVVVAVSHAGSTGERAPSCAQSRQEGFLEEVVCELGCKGEHFCRQEGKLPHPSRQQGGAEGLRDGELGTEFNPVMSEQDRSDYGD